MSILSQWADTFFQEELDYFTDGKELNSYVLDQFLAWDADLGLDDF